MLAYMNDKWRLFRAKLVNAHKSFHIWFNSLAGTIVILLPYMQDQFPRMTPYLSETAFRYAMGGIVLANIVSRFYIIKSLSQK